LSPLHPNFEHFRKYWLKQHYKFLILFSPQQALQRKINQCLLSILLVLPVLHLDQYKMYEKGLEGKLKDIYDAVNWDFPNENLKKAQEFFDFESPFPIAVS
jgi:hypothetical protein